MQPAADAEAARDDGPGAGAVPLDVVPEAALLIDADNRVVEANELAAAALRPRRHRRAADGAARRARAAGGTTTSRCDCARRAATATTSRSSSTSASRTATPRPATDWSCCASSTRGCSSTRSRVACWTTPSRVSRSGWPSSIPRASTSASTPRCAGCSAQSQEELLGNRDQEFTHPDDRASDVAAAWRILNGEIDTWQTEKRFVLPSTAPSSGRSRT